MIEFITNGNKKLEYLRAIPLGATISIESFCGGRTIKIGEPFPEKYDWKIDCLYFDYDRPPGSAYVEDVNNILIRESEYNEAMQKKAEADALQKRMEDDALKRSRRRIA